MVDLIRGLLLRRWCGAFYPLEGRRIDLPDGVWPMKRFLFVCSQNRLRSPTAEQIFSAREDIEVDSAGTNHDAENPLSAELLEWADVIFVMERTHRGKIQQRFRKALKGKQIVCLDIPDDYAFMDPQLIALLQSRMARHLPN